MPVLYTLPRVTFTTNATGAGSTDVLVKLTGYNFYGPTNSTTWWAVGMESPNIVLETACICGPGKESTSEVASVSIAVGGLTPSTEYTLFWFAQSLDSAYEIDFTDPCGGGATYLTVPTVLGCGAVMEVWAA